MIKKINILFISIFITSLVILLTSTNTYAAIIQSFTINDTAFGLVWIWTIITICLKIT